MSENGVLYANPEEDGQKTGFTPPKREPSVIRSLARAKAFDTFLTGGFSVNAALNGASSVTRVDSSAPALDAARKNVELNGLRLMILTWSRPMLSLSCAMKRQGQL